MQPGRKLRIGATAGAAVVVTIFAFSSFTANTARKRRAAAFAARLAALPVTDNRQPPDSTLVIENPAPDPTRPAFQVSPEAVTTVGLRRDDPALLQEDPDYDLWSVQDATLTAEGRLVVVNPRDEVRVFDARGEHLFTVSGEGQGPGDINRVRQVAALDDGSLAVWDEQLQRVTSFDRDGRPTLTTSAAIRAICCFGDGAFLVRRSSSYSIVEGTRGPSLIRGYRDRGGMEIPEVVGLHIAPLERGRARTDSILMLDGEDALVGYRTGDGGGWVSPPFDRSGHFVLAGDRIVYGRGDVYEFLVYARTGELIGAVRTAAPGTPLTSDGEGHLRNSWIHADHAGSEGAEERHRAQVRALDQAFDTLEVPLNLPAYDRIEGEEDGSVWVQRYALPGTDAPEWWAGFDPEGRLLGTLPIPQGFTVVRFTRGHVILREPVGDYGFVGLGVYRIEGVGSKGEGSGS